MEAAFQSGFASALLDVLFNKVTDAFLTELKKFKIVNEDVNRLKDTIEQAHEQLRNVGTFVYVGKAEHFTKKQVDTLTRLCYDAEDIMAEIAVLISEHNSDSGNKLRWLVRQAIPKALQTRTITENITELQKKFDRILQQLKEHEVTRNRSNEHIPETSSNCNYGVPLVGRDNDAKNIIRELISNKSSKGVSIIGPDGLGKTTLAYKILDDLQIEFPVSRWVTMSNGCSKFKEKTDRLMLDINSSCSKQKQNVIIVFDNLLKVKYTDWDNFWCGMKKKKNSNKKIGEIKILITTCDPRISEKTDTFAYNLNYLSDECCKELIMQKACEKHLDSSEEWLSNAAGELASWCEGFPSVARLLGLVLAGRQKDIWTLLLEDLWNWPEFETEILPVLSSSYNGMELHLKKCLAYFSLFPQNHCFNMEDLVQLWVGEEFIEQTKFGQRCIDDLVGRSILQSSNEANIGWPRYKLRKFSQNFARFAASTTCSQLKDMSCLSSINTDNTRHLSLLCENVHPSFWTKLRDFTKLRTILLLYTDKKRGQLGEIPPNIFKSSKRLRVLGLNRTDVDELPASIGKLKYLRYLDVSNTPMKTLPHELCNVVTLQFLKLNKTKLLSLPDKFQNLTNLLYVDWDTNDVVNLRVPPHIGNIRGLQTLPLFYVGNKEGYFITELEHMNCLQGSIHIQNLENVKDATEAADAKLDQKQSLSRIELQWNSSSNDSHAKGVLMNLRPPRSLEELKLTNYGGDSFPDWLVYRFHRLRKIHLKRCRSCTTLPALGQQPVLETLVLEEMSKMSSIDFTSAGSFPSLKLLEFNDMPKLQEWIGLEKNDLPRLQILKLIDCPEMIDIPSLENLSPLQDLHIRRCEKMKSLPTLPTSLKLLIIRESSLLTVHCQEGGNEWPKINRVPHVEIDDAKIQTSGVSSHPSTSSSIFLVDEKGAESCPTGSCMKHRAFRLLHGLFRSSFCFNLTDY